MHTYQAETLRSGDSEQEPGGHPEADAGGEHGWRYEGSDPPTFTGWAEKTAKEMEGRPVRRSSRVTCHGRQNQGLQKESQLHETPPSSHTDKEGETKTRSHGGTGDLDRSSQEKGDWERRRGEKEETPGTKSNVPL